MSSCPAGWRYSTTSSTIAGRKLRHRRERRLARSRRHGRRQRSVRRIQGGARPTAVALPYEFIGRPVVLVELERNDVRLAVPAHRRQAQRRTIGLAAYHLD